MTQNHGCIFGRQLTPTENATVWKRSGFTCVLRGLSFRATGNSSCSSLCLTFSSCTSFSGVFRLHVATNSFLFCYLFGTCADVIEQSTSDKGSAHACGYWSTRERCNLTITLVIYRNGIVIRLLLWMKTGSLYFAAWFQHILCDCLFWCSVCDLTQIGKLQQKKNRGRQQTLQSGKLNPPWTTLNIQHNSKQNIYFLCRKWLPAYACV